MQTPEIPDEFIRRYKDLVDNPEAFFAALQKRMPKAIRINTLKTTRQEVLERLKKYGITATPIPWYQDAFNVDEHTIGTTLDHFMGYIYIQELASMLPPLLVAEELKSAQKILDACAAPGSKTTQIAAMAPHAQIIANDSDYMRVKALRANVDKVGAINVIITEQDLRRYPQEEKYDLIFLDAPCSAEGTVRKKPDVLTHFWSHKKVTRFENLQKQLIIKCFDLLKDKGTMIYSTCTFSTEENEGVLTYLLKKRPAQLKEIEIPGLKLTHGVIKWQDKEFDPQVKKAKRLFPHHNNTGGFFLAKITK